MTMIDDRGRLFGRFNLIDSLVVLLVLIAIPMAYGTYLLFRPGTPRIDSVSPSNITKEEQRVTNTARLVAKFKIKGTGFTPLLRARIGDADALGFVFENPNSADVLVGPIPAGPQDLILMDGVQEVARAQGAITVVPERCHVLTSRRPADRSGRRAAEGAPGRIRMAGRSAGLQDSRARASRAGPVARQPRGHDCRCPARRAERTRGRPHAALRSVVRR